MYPSVNFNLKCWKYMTENNKYRDWNKHIEGFNQKAVEDEDDIGSEVGERSLVSTYCPCSNVRHQKNDKHVAEDKKVKNFWNITW